jgi:hypothetical protein
MGGTMLRPSCIPPLAESVHFCFETDQRSFSPNIHASSRMHSEITIDLDTGLALSQWHNTDCTFAFSCESAALLCAKRASTDMMNFPTIVSSPDGTITVFLDGSAGDPCVPLAQLLARIRYRGTFTIDVSAQTIDFAGEISEFPAYEAYAAADGGAPKLLFVASPFPGITACDIPSAPLRNVSGHTNF